MVAVALISQKYRLKIDEIELSLDLQNLARISLKSQYHSYKVSKNSDIPTL